MWEPQSPATLRASMACTGITIYFFNSLELGTSLEVSSQLHAPATLPPGKEPQVPNG
jgi:hypothetical protein